MDVAVGLPNAVGGTTGEQLLGFAREAEARGFSSLGTLDRIVFYGWLGDEFARQIAASAATDPETVTQYVSAFEQAGCDELFMFACGSDPEQATFLAEALGK